MLSDALSIGRPTFERRLDNGLTVLVRQDDSSPVVAIVTHVKAGYFDEPDRLVGISHVLEHMYFKGTARRSAGEMAQEIRGLGGYLNAGTIYDYTSYYTVLPANALEQGLEIQADALRHLAIDEDELRRELIVIIEEAKRKLDNPGAVSLESLYEEMFDVHRMRRWRIGTEEGLRRLTREDVWTYYRDLYRASNLIVVVAGAVEPDPTFALVERLYGGMPAGDVVRSASPPEPDRTGFRLRQMTGDIMHAYMEWGWRTPGTLHPDTPFLDLLGIALGQGRASRLYRGVRERGLASSVSAYNYTPTETGVFGVRLELPPADALDAAKAVAREIDALRASELAKAEIERARNLMEAQLLRRAETVEGQATMLADWQALGDWRRLGEYLDRIESATTADLRRVAGEYLSLDRATMLVYRAEGSAGLDGGAEALYSALTEAAAETTDTIRAEAVAEPAATVPAASTRGTGVAGIGREDGVHFYHLPGDIEVAVKPRAGTPLVSAGLIWRGGPLLESAGNAALTGLMTRVSLKGTARRSGEALADAVEALGGILSPLVSADGFKWHLSVPSRHLEPGLALLAEAALQPVFPEAELERERRVALSDLERLRDDMFRFPFRLVLHGGFGDHPYGLSDAATEAGILAATRDGLMDWHHRHVLRTRPIAVVVGDVEPDRVAACIAPLLEAIEPDTGQPDPARPAWTPRPREISRTRAKAQTAIMLGFPGPSRTDPDRFIVQVLANAISGLGSRLFEELRSRRSLAYHVAAYPVFRWLGGAFAAFIATSPDREAEARQALLEEIERLSEENLSREEVERSQRYTLGALRIRAQTNGAVLAELADALLLGDGLVELREREARIRAVTPAQIREIARRYLRPDRMVAGIVRGNATASAGEAP